MDKMLKFESPRHLSKIKTSNSLNDKINQHKKMKKKLRSSNDSPQDMQTLPVPTVPPYPIEYFENSSFGNTNRAFHCTDEFLENPNFKSSSSEEGKENETDSVKEKSLQKLVNSKLLPNNFWIKLFKHTTFKHTTHYKLHESYRKLNLGKARPFLIVPCESTF